MKRIKIIFVNNYGFPIRNPRVNRIRTLYRILSKQYDIEIISNRVKGFNEDLQEQNNTRVGFSIFNNTVKSESLIKLKAWFKRIIFPDLLVFHGFGLFRYLLSKKELDDTILVSFSPPVSVLFWINILRIFRKNFFWISDIGDLIYNNPTNRLWTGMDRGIQYLENKIMNNSDYLVFNSINILDFYITQYPFIKYKTCVIPNGSSINFEKLNSKIHDGLVFSYFGSTYEPTRSGIREIEILKQVNLEITKYNIKMEIILAGRLDKKISSLADNSIKVFNQLDEFSLIQLYETTDFLVSFANLNYEGIPSKISEYLASGLPLIIFTYDESDRNLNQMREFPRVFIYSIENTESTKLVQWILNITDRKIKADMSEDIRIFQSWNKIFNEARNKF